MPELKFPELDKLEKVSKASHEIGWFLDWLSEHGIALCETKNQEAFYHEYVRVRKSKEQLLADYFEIDLEKVEEEREQLLEHIRTLNP